MSKIQRFGLFSSNCVSQKNTRADTLPSESNRQSRVSKRQRTSASPESEVLVPASSDGISRRSPSVDMLRTMDSSSDGPEDRHMSKRNHRNILSNDEGSDDDGYDDTNEISNGSGNLAPSNSVHNVNDLEPSLQLSSGKANAWAEYERHRERYQKYMKLAEEAFEEMNRAAKLLSQSTTLPKQSQQPSTSATESHHHNQVASEVVLSKGSTQYQPRTVVAISSQSFSRQRANSDDSHTMPVLAPKKTNLVKEKRRERQLSDASNIGPGFDAEADALKSNNKAARPFQFNTSLHSAFQRKPRAALVCQLEGVDYPMAVAYGMDGTVQIWDPCKQRRNQMLTTSALGMDFPEHMAQVTPSLLAAVAGVRSTADSLGGQGRLVFLSQHDAMRQSHEWLGDAQHWNFSPHKGPISVVEGMAGQSTRDRGMLLTGGLRDHEVFLWSLEMDGAKVAASTTMRQLRTHHSSRIGALFFEYNRGCVLSGSDSGRIGMNDAETGKDLGGHMPQGRPSNAVGNIVVCPANPNIVLISYAATDRQLRVVDLRQRLAFAYPVLSLGQHRERTQSRYIRPAWHPDSGLIFYPIHQGSSDTSSDGTVAIWDTRYASCSDTAPQMCQLHKQTVWSVGFSENTMVSVSGDYNIGFTTFRI